MGDMDLVRALGLAGIKSVVVAAPGRPERFSRFTRASIDPAGPRPLLDSLLDYAATRPVKPVLFYESDSDLSFLLEHRALLAASFRFVLPGTALVKGLLDKARFQEIAEELGLPVPRGIRLEPFRQDPPSGFPFPAVLKAVPYRNEGWDLERKVADFSRAEDLASAWSSLAATRHSFVLQQLIPGPEQDVLSYHAYVDAQGEVVAEFTGRKLRTYPTQFGHSTALTTTEDRPTRVAGRQVLRALDFRGVAKVDFKRTPDGQLHLLEVNPRFSLWVHLGAVAGTNLPAIVYADLTGGIRPERAPPRAGLRWVRLRDMKAARSEGSTRLRWAAWARSAEANSAGFSWDDPLPLLLSRSLRLVDHLRAFPLRVARAAKHWHESRA